MVSDTVSEFRTRNKQERLCLRRELRLERANLISVHCLYSSFCRVCRCPIHARQLIIISKMQGKSNQIGPTDIKRAIWDERVCME